MRVAQGAYQGNIPDLRPEIEAFLLLEREHNSKWGRVKFKALDADAGYGLALRLAADWPLGVNLKIMERALGKRTKEDRLGRHE
jgi:hypothetical protein